MSSAHIIMSLASCCTAIIAAAVILCYVGFASAAGARRNIVEEIGLPPDKNNNDAFLRTATKLTDETNSLRGRAGDTADLSYKYLITTLPGRQSTVTYGKNQQQSQYQPPIPQQQYEQPLPPAQQYQPSPPKQYQSPPPAPAPPVTPYQSRVILGGACVDDGDCGTVKNSRCVAGICSCAPSTVPLSNIACVPVAQSFGSSCVISAQCRALDPLASCYLDRCICESIYNVAGQDCQAPNTGDYFSVSATPTGISCVRKKHLGQTCCSDRQCSYEVWNSECSKSDSTCQCARNYINIGNHQCAPKVMSVGGACSTNAQCMFDGGECDNGGHCSCNLPYWCDDSGPAGARRRRQVTTDSSAGTGGFVHCVRTKLLGEGCINNYQCNNRTAYSACINGVCSCQRNYVRVDGIQQCAPTITGLGTNNSCVVSGQCLTTNAICNSTTDTCTCNSNFYCEVNGACQPMTSMAGACSNDCQCSTVNSVCSSGRCACVSGYHFNANNNTCIASALEFDNGINLYKFIVGCCRNNTAARFVGQVLLDPDGLGSTAAPTFSLSTTSTVYSIDPSTGVISAAASPNQMTVTTLTVTASASGYTSATVTVVITPEPCCSNFPTMTMTTALIATLMPTAGKATPNCGGTTTAVVANQAMNAGMLAVAPFNVFTTPCGEIPSQTITIATMPAQMCGMSGGFITYTGATGGPSALATVCMFVATATACNGLTATAMLSLTISFGANCG